MLDSQWLSGELVYQICRGSYLQLKLRYHNTMFYTHTFTLRQKLLSLVLLALLPSFLLAQEADMAKEEMSKEEMDKRTPVYQTFKDRRVINAQSVETLAARKLDVRIGHRFGDLLGNAGGWPTFYGLENATDVMIGADYGVTDRFDMGLYRTKGASELRQLVSTIAKYKLFQQYEEIPNSISVTALGVLSISTMSKGSNPDAINFFSKFSHRMAYTAQLIIAQKFSENFSLQFTPSYTHRNIVNFGDVNDTYSLGVALRVQLTRVIGIIADVTMPMNGEQSPLTRTGTGTVDYRVPLGIGFEFDTGGHIFQVNLTNATGLMEPDYIPNTTSSWTEGEFRLGFTISRLFNL